MADTSGIKAGRAFVELGVNDKLQAGLNRAAAQVKAFGEGIRSIGVKIGALGAGITGSMLASSYVFAEGSKELLSMSRRTQISVEALSALKYAATQSGVEVETLETSLRKMQKTIGAASEGSKEAAGNIASIGLSAKELLALEPDEQFAMIADRLSALSNDTDRAAAAMAIFGKAGTTILPLTENGAAGISKLTKEAKEFGLVASTEGVKAGAALQNSLERLWAEIKKVNSAIAIALAPELTRLTNIYSRAVQQVVVFIKHHKETVTTIFKLGGIATAAGTALVALGTAVIGLGAIMRASSFAFGGLRAIMAATVSMISTLAAGVVGMAAAIVSPLGIAVAAIAAFGGMWVYQSGVIGKVLDFLRVRFASLSAFISEVVNTIGASLTAGDIQSAADVLWASLKLVWVEGSAALSRIWLAMRGFLVRVAIGGWTAIISAAETAFHGLSVGWIETTSFLYSAWERFSSAVQLGWATIKAIAQKVWNDIKGLFSSDFNSEAANAAVDEALVAAEQKITADKAAALAEIERSRKSRLDKEGTTHSGALAQFGIDEQNAMNGLAADADKQTADARDKLAAARDAYAKASEAAKAKAAKFQADNESGSPTGPGKFGLETATRGLAIGSFNASRIAGLGPGSAQERTAKAAEEHVALAKQQNKGIQKIADRIAKFGTFT